MIDPCRSNQETTQHLSNVSNLEDAREARVNEIRPQFKPLAMQLFLRGFATYEGKTVTLKDVGEEGKAHRGDDELIAYIEGDIEPLRKLKKLCCEEVVARLMNVELWEVK